MRSLSTLSSSSDEGKKKIERVLSVKLDRQLSAGNVSWKGITYTTNVYDFQSYSEVPE